MPSGERARARRARLYFIIRCLLCEGGFTYHRPPPLHGGYAARPQDESQRALTAWFVDRTSVRNGLRLTGGVVAGQVERLPGQPTAHLFRPSSFGFIPVVNKHVCGLYARITVRPPPTPQRTDPRAG